jgi:chorismate mutase/prephenate dehydrogenase
VSRTLAELDVALFALLAERARVIDSTRAEGALDTFEHERRLIDAARAFGAASGLDAVPLAEALVRMDVFGAGPVPEREPAQFASEGRAEPELESSHEAQAGSALVIGGGGRMGGWMADFLARSGWGVTVADPAGSPSGHACVASWRDTELDHDLIVVAAPLRPSNDVLHALAEARPKGLVFDVGSLKSPLRTGLRAVRDAGVRVTSVHPMFGPDVELLHGRHVIFIDLGDAEACEEAESLFAHTAATRIRMTLDEHDRVIAYVLGLSHALNIAFVTAVAESGEAAPRLAELSSTTFEAQLDVARRVVRENPHLYFEIQHLNDYGVEALSALSYAVEKVRSVVRAGDEANFVRLMEQGDRYVRGR